MRKQELLDALAKEAASLEVAPPGEAVLRSWIDKGLVPKAEAKGGGLGIAPAWDYSPDALDAAREIVGLKAQGARRTAELRIGLFLSGFVQPMNLVRDALISEQKRFVSRWQRIREVLPDFLESVEDESEVAKGLERLPKQDARLNEARSLIPEKLLVHVASLTLRGTSETPAIASILRPYQLSPNAEAFEGTQIENYSASLITALFAGFAADIDESDLAFEGLLKHATDDDLQVARSAYVQVLRALEAVSFASSEIPQKIFEFSALAARTLHHQNWHVLVLSGLVAMRIKLREVSGGDELWNSIMEELRLTTRFMMNRTSGSSAPTSG